MFRFLHDTFEAVTLQVPPTHRPPTGQS